MPAALTVVIEICVFVLAGYRDRYFIMLCAAVNLLTNLTLNLILSFTGWEYLILAGLEAFAVIAEYLCYSAAVGRNGRLFGLTLAANLVSFIIGAILFW